MPAKSAAACPQCAIASGTARCAFAHLRVRAIIAKKVRHDPRLFPRRPSRNRRRTGPAMSLTVMANVEQVRAAGVGAAGQPSQGVDGRHHRADGRLRRAVRSAYRAGAEFRARLGPRRAAGGALLCRHQPLHRERLRRRLRAQSAIATRSRSRRQIRAASPIATPNRPHRRPRRPCCSGATAACCARSTRSARARCWSRAAPSVIELE